MMNIFVFKTFWILTPIAQIICIAVLFLVTTFIQFREYKKTGKMYTYYPLRLSLLFVPIYEEIIFRGLILGGLMSYYSAPTAIVISSLLFSLWHIKNIFYAPKRAVAHQVVYTGVIFGPIVSYITIFTGTIWIAVILHYLNNILAPYSQKLFSNKRK